jgi:hypothetical protein
MFIEHFFFINRKYWNSFSGKLSIPKTKKKLESTLQVVDLQIVEELEQRSKEFFHLSSNDKRKYAIENSMSLTGYAGFESLTNYVPHANEIFVIHSPFLFPNNSEELCFKYNFEPFLSKYIESCWKLNKKINGTFLNRYPPNGFFIQSLSTAAITKSKSLLITFSLIP